MIRSLIRHWLFINYCGQKIGQFKGADLKDTLLNVTTSNISFIVYGILLNIYILLGFKSFLLFLIVAIPFEFLVTRRLLRRYIMSIISIEELDSLYKSTPRWKRILIFILTLMIIICSVVFFFMIISMKFW